MNFPSQFAYRASGLNETGKRFSLPCLFRNRTVVINILLTTIWLLCSSASACTIVSAVATNGEVWTSNNEDGPVGVANFINVFPRSANVKYGYFTLSYLSPRLGQGSSIQGGFNEAGLTFDFNSINSVRGFNPKLKKAFPEGDDQILTYILSSLNTVDQVVSFFETYWFQNGFNSAQMHVADRSGKRAIISASGIQVVEKGQQLISTNFDICGKEDDSACWRYAKANAILREHEVGLTTMLLIAKETAQGENTLYSNIQNLTTGDVWFLSNHDSGILLKTNIRDMLAKGRASYSFSELNSLKEERPARQRSKFFAIALDERLYTLYEGIFVNAFIGKLIVERQLDGIKITPEDNNAFILQPLADTRFFLPSEDVEVEFIHDKKTNELVMRLYENGFWLFNAKKQESVDTR